MRKSRYFISNFHQKLVMESIIPIDFSRIQSLLSVIEKQLQLFIHHIIVNTPTVSSHTVVSVTPFVHQLQSHPSLVEMHFSILSQTINTDLFVYGAAYDPRDRRVHIFLPEKLRIHGAITDSSIFIHNQVQFLRSSLIHELTHRGQFVKREGQTTQPLPIFGMSARSDAIRFQRNPSELPRGWMSRPASSLVRTSAHLRYPRTEEDEYFGHPEEIMAYATEMSQYILGYIHAKSDHEKHFFIKKIEGEYEHVVSRFGINSPAYKRYWKLVYLHVQPHMAFSELSRILGNIRTIIRSHKT